MWRDAIGLVLVGVTVEIDVFLEEYALGVANGNEYSCLSANPRQAD